MPKTVLPSMNVIERANKAMPIGDETGTRRER